MPGTVKSDPPTGGSLVGELGSESGMTPLHLAAYSGNENVVRLLLNSAGVQVFKRLVLLLLFNDDELTSNP